MTSENNSKLHWIFKGIISTMVGYFIIIPVLKALWNDLLSSFFISTLINTFNDYARVIAADGIKMDPFFINIIFLLGLFQIFYSLYLVYYFLTNSGREFLDMFLKSKFFKITIPILAIVLFTISGFRAVNSATRSMHDIEYNTTFKQYLKILTPKITNEKLNQLKADWAKMDEWGDIKNNLMVIDSIAVNNNIKLPAMYKLH